MTGQELITEIREHFDEPEPQAGEDSYLSGTRLLEQINRIHRRIVKRTGCVYRQTNYYDSDAATYQNAAASVAARYAHYLPTDFWMIHWQLGVWWNDDTKGGYPLRPVDKLSMGRDEKNWTPYQTSGLPELYEIRQVDKDVYDGYAPSDIGINSGIALNVYPAPAASGNLLQAFYIPAVSDISLTTAPLFDEEFQDAIVFEVVALCKEKREKLDIAANWRLRAKQINDRMNAYYDRKSGEQRLQVAKTTGTGQNSFSYTITNVP